MPRLLTETNLAPLRAVMFKRARDEGLPGLVFGYRQGDDWIVEADGSHTLEAKAHMHTDTLFRIASMTKPIAGVAAMMLVEEGTVALDDPVDRLLPELAERKVLKRMDGPLDDTVPAERPITLRDLLTCRMGMGIITLPGDFPIQKAMAERGVNVGARHPPEMTADTWIARLGELPLIHQPGTVWMYDTSIEVLGVLIQRASGRSLGDFFRERIFAPLGMRDTGFRVRPGDAARLPALYRPDRQKGGLRILDPAGRESRFLRPKAFQSASDGLVSTAEDCLAFATMMLNRGQWGKRRLISEGSYRAMTTDQITREQKARSPFFPKFWKTHGWGYCLAVWPGPEPSDPKGYGWMGGYGTAMAWDPESGLASVVMTQRLMDDAAFPVVRDFWRGIRAITG